jgi:hypothetical protein
MTCPTIAIASTGRGAYSRPERTARGGDDFGAVLARFEPDRPARDDQAGPGADVAAQTAAASATPGGTGGAPGKDTPTAEGSGAESASAGTATVAGVTAAAQPLLGALGPIGTVTPSAVTPAGTTTQAQAGGVAGIGGLTTVAAPSAGQATAAATPAGPPAGPAAAGTPTTNVPTAPAPPTAVDAATAPVDAAPTGPSVPTAPVTGQPDGATGVGATPNPAAGAEPAAGATPTVGATFAGAPVGVADAVTADVTAAPQPAAPTAPTAPAPVDPAGTTQAGVQAGAQALGATAPATPVAAPAPAAAPAAPATPAPPAQQLAMHIAPLRLDADGVHRLTVHLHPADLGQVSVIAEIRNGAIQVHLAGGTDAGREALRAALPDLRRDLQDAGFSSCELDLRQDAPGGGQPQERRAGVLPGFASGTTTAAEAVDGDPGWKPRQTTAHTHRLDLHV